MGDIMADMDDGVSGKGKRGKGKGHEHEDGTQGGHRKDMHSKTR